MPKHKRVIQAVYNEAIKPSVCKRLVMSSLKEDIVTYSGAYAYRKGNGGSDGYT